MSTIRPSVECVVDLKPLQTLDECTWNEATMVPNWFAPTWSRMYMDLHEGLDAQKLTMHSHRAASVGHVFARVPKISYVHLDYCIRRGCNISCHNMQGYSVLRQALMQAALDSGFTPAGLLFFRVLADAHALLYNTEWVPKDTVAEQIRQYIVKYKMDSWDAAIIDLDVFEQAAVMYGK
jgi:hypothetical protein